jgi:hypothetical protein
MIALAEADVRDLDGVCAPRRLVGDGCDTRQKFLLPLKEPKSVALWKNANQINIGASAPGPTTIRFWH